MAPSIAPWHWPSCASLVPVLPERSIRTRKAPPGAAPAVASGSASAGATGGTAGATGSTAGTSGGGTAGSSGRRLGWRGWRQPGRRPGDRRRRRGRAGRRHLHARRPQRHVHPDHAAEPDGLRRSQRSDEALAARHLVRGQQPAVVRRRRQEPRVRAAAGREDPRRSHDGSLGLPDGHGDDQELRVRREARRDPPLHEHRRLDVDWLRVRVERPGCRQADRRDGRRDPRLGRYVRHRQANGALVLPEPARLHGLPQ